MATGNIYAADAPENVTATQYSSKNGEIFWDRVNRPIVGYELTRNGQILGVFDALSYYDDTFKPGELYTYTISTVEADGKTRSDAVTVQLGDGASTPNKPDGDTPDVDPELPQEPDDDTPPTNASTSSVLNSVRVQLDTPNSAYLIWDETSTPGITYEININDRPPVVTDSNRFFMDQLDDNQSNSVSIRSISADEANTSIRHGFFFNTSGRTFREFVAPVTDLRVDIYSSKNAEIFWSRVQTEPLRYEVLLNGETVSDGEQGNLTYATSQYLDNLAPGSLNTVSVIAFNGNRASSFAMNVSFTMPNSPDLFVPPGSVSPISTDNAESVLSNVFGIIDGNGHKRISDEALLIELNEMEPENPLPGFTVISTEQVEPSGAVKTTYACADGGTFSQEGRGYRDLTFSECTVSGVSRNGQLTFTLGSALGGSRQYDNYVRAEAGDVLRLTGERGFAFLTSGESGTSNYNYSRNLTSSQKTPDGEVRVSGFRSDSRRSRSFLLSQSYDTDFSVRAYWSQNRLLKVENTRAFSDVDIQNTYFERGVLRIIDSAEPENFIEINAQTGDSNTYLFTLSVQGETMSEIRKWEDLTSISGNLVLEPRSLDPNR